MGLARLGVFLNFVSHSVILGFSAGAAVLIAFKQLPNLLGLAPVASRLHEIPRAIAVRDRGTHPATIAFWGCSRSRSFCR